MEMAETEEKKGVERRSGESRPPREGRPGGGGGGPRSGNERGSGEGRGDRGRDNRGGGRPGGGDRRPEGPPEIDLDKLISDSLYLDNQAHVVVSRMRDMDSGTKSQLRRLYNAVRRATRTPESERQHEFDGSSAPGIHHRASFAA